MTQTILLGDLCEGEIDALREREGLKGVAMTVVERDGSVVTLTKGIRSEQGEPVTQNVNLFFSSWAH